MVVTGIKSVSVTVVTPAMIELVNTVMILLVMIVLLVCTRVSVEAMTVDIELGVKRVLVLMVFVVTLTCVKMSEETEKVVTVRVVVVAPCKVAVMAGVGGGDVQATGNKLLHARRKVVKGVTPKAVQLPATQALVPEVPKQPTSTLDNTVSMGSWAVYGCSPRSRQARLASSP